MRAVPWPTMSDEKAENSFVVTSPRAARIAVSDPLPMFQRGVADTMSAVGYIVESPEDIMDWASVPGSDVVVLTLLEPADWSTLAALRNQRPNVATIATIESGDLTQSVRALSSGAIGILPREADSETVRTVLSAAVSGQSVLPMEVIRALASPDHRPQASSIPSEAEISWIRNLARGTTVAQLAAQSGYSERMMFRLLRDLYERWGLATRTEAIIYARDNGWL